MSNIAAHRSTSRPFALVVTADDFGIGLQTSRGIVLAHQKGPVTATSMMVVTGDHARASVPLLAEAPNLDLGLHLVLTNCGHKPLVAKASSGLVDRDGLFLSNGRLWMRAWSGRLNKAAVGEEIAAQGELFRQLIGRRPSYVDGHHHAHQLPIIREALIEVMSKGLLPPVTRVTIEPPGWIRHVASVRSRRRAAHLLGNRASSRFAKAGIKANDFYFGMLGAADLRRDFPWESYLKQMPTLGMLEWIVHPGLHDETLTGRDEYRTERARELECLTSPAGMAAWNGLRPCLASKSSLSNL
jgi:predicted glycoside hydrolase/deacetylase ChbG (UPF0249 family)